MLHSESTYVTHSKSVSYRFWMLRILDTVLSLKILTPHDVDMKPIQTGHVNMQEAEELPRSD